jgi:hypothetical protein
MNITRLNSPVISFIIMIVLAIFFSSLTLWLVESWIKYPLFFYEVFVIILIYFLLCKSNNNNYYSFKFTNVTTNIIKNAVKVKKILRGFILDLILISFSSFLIVLNGFHIQGLAAGFLQLIFAFLCTAVLSGYALLNIFKIIKALSKLEILLLSFVLSFIFSGFATLALLNLDEQTRSIIMPLFYVIIGTISLLRNKKEDSRGNTENQKHHSFSRKIDALAITLSILFYLIFFCSVYPNFSLLAASDISRHYNYSIVLSRTPDLYTQFSYILFHAFYVSFYTLSGLHQPLTSIQSILVSLNVFLPIFVYTLAKRFLENLDRRIPGLSVIFYSVLSNFSFIYFTQLKLMNAGSTEIQMLQVSAAEKTFNGTINFLQPFAWFVPLSVSFMMFIMAFMLLKVQDIPKSKFVPLFSIIIFAMYLTHVTEAIVFVVSIAIYSFISKSTTLRLYDALLSSLIGFLSAAAFFGIRSFFWISDLSSVNIDFKAVLAVVIPILLIGTSLLWRAKLGYKIELYPKFRFGGRFYFFLSVALTAVYLFGYIAWFFSEDFRTSSIYTVGAVPWFIYPLMLGITGLLAILSIRYLNEILPNSSVSLLLAVILIMFIFGRFITFLNFNLSYLASGYWEKRFLVFLFMFLSLLAPISLIKFREQIVNLELKTKKQHSYRIAFLTAIIGTIVVSGFCSSALQTEYWVVTADSKKINDKEFQAITYLRGVLGHDTHAFTVSPSTYSKQALTFAAPVYQYPLSEVLTNSKYPDIPLFALSAHNLKHAYVYMHTRDLKALTNGKQSSWFGEHFISMLPVVYSNGEVTIYNATHASPPSPYSDIHMVLPAETSLSPRASWFYAYDVISQSNKNYTTVYSKDPNALKAKTVILSFDPAIYRPFYEKFSKDSSNNNRWIIVSGNSTNWNYSSEGLHGGHKLGTILSPIFSRNSVVSTSFRINSISPHVANYVSIVHSWIDAKNYKYAGIMILRDSVYINFATVTNGKVTFIPRWPGIKTDFEWKPGALFNMSLQDDTNSNRVGLKLNDTKFIGYSTTASNHNIEPGYAGLSYNRVNDVIFKHFDSRQLKQAGTLDAEDLSSYIRYVASGGHLIVLNTNGYGSIANFLFNRLNSFLAHNEIRNISSAAVSSNNSNNSNNNNNNLNMKNQVITVSKENPNPLSFYTSPKGNTFVFAKNATIGKGHITYINVHPLISLSLDNKTLGRVVYPLLGAISKLLDSNSKEAPRAIVTPANFKDIIESHGNIEVNTTSLMLPSNKVDQLKITYPNHREYLMKNVSNLKFNGYSSVILRGQTDANLTLSNGKGLYAGLGFSTISPLEIHFASNTNSGRSSASILGLTNDRPFRFNNISSISIMNKLPVYIYARQPSLNFHHASVILKDLNFASISGGDVKISGDVFLSIFMSDLHTFANHLNIHGTMQSLAPAFNEIKYLVPAISVHKVYSIPAFARFLSIIPILIAGILVIYARPKKVLNEHS